jgi:hypothetical protein
MRPAGPGIPVNVGSHHNSSIGKARAQRFMLFFISAILCALAIYVVAFFGFSAAIKCEVDSYRLLHRTPAVITEIAAANGCGF